MADRKGFYHVTEALTEYWQSRGDVNTITIGKELSDIDIQKQSIYPLIYVGISPTSGTEKTLTYNFDIYFADVVDVSTQDTRTRLEVSRGNDDYLDVLHNMEAIATETFAYFKRGAGYSNLFQMSDSFTLEEFYDNWANGISGWLMSVEIEVPNSPSIC